MIVQQKQAILMPVQKLTPKQKSTMCPWLKLVYNVGRLVQFVIVVLAIAATFFVIFTIVAASLRSQSPVQSSDRASTVYVGNFSSHFHGWKRATIDRLPSYKAGISIASDGQEVYWVLGRPIGSDARAIDLLVDVPPGETLSVDLSSSRRWDYSPLPPVPPDVYGTPKIGNSPLAFKSIQQDGAGYLVHLTARLTQMLFAHVWVQHYPGQRGWAQAEVVVIASNPTIPDVTTPTPDNSQLTWGSAFTIVPGKPQGQANLLPTTTFASGQGMAFPVTFVWPALMNADDWSSASSASTLSVSALGISRVWREGNPEFRDTPLTWARQYTEVSKARIHTWTFGPLGVAARSGDTGAQEDQVFVGGECAQGIRSLGAEYPGYLAAMGQFRRPCYHLELDGSLVTPANHPQLVIWSGQPHYDTRVSPDQLGKPRKPTIEESHGAEGPDREHWLINRVAVAYRLTGSPALQFQLEANAQLFLLQETVNPRLSTSGWSAERAIGWAAIVADHLDLLLENRALAASVVQRWRDRVTQVYIPQLTNKPQGIWYPRKDARLTADTGWEWSWMPYQQSVGAAFLDRACSHIGPPEGRVLALASARQVLEAWERQPDASYKPWAYLGYSADGTQPPFSEGQGAHYGAGVWVWMMPAIQTILDHNPEDLKAGAIKAAYRNVADPKWLGARNQ